MPYYLNQKKEALNGLLGRIHNAVYTPLADLAVTAWATTEPVSYAERESGTKLDLTPGQKWGDLFDCAWFHFTGVVPVEAAGKQVVLLIDVNGEALVVDDQGNPVQGLTNVESGYDFSLGTPGKRVVPVADCAAGGEAIDLWADAGCNDLFGVLRGDGTLKEARIAICHPQMHALLYDFEVLHELMQQLPEDSPRWNSLWAALNAAAGVLRRFTDDEAAAAREILAPELAKRGGDPSLTISAIGHAHIDLGWLWPIRETIRKGARTFATALRFMERYPDYHFGASQPQLYRWMKDHYPTVYAEVTERIAEDRWETQGAMWVEADTNVPSGESLVRQVLYGKRFFREEFGKTITHLWLPDVFGYSAALPQILRKAGVEFFVTQKMSWSFVNHFPHHTFWWQGIDGSRVLAHMLPEETYNSPASPRALAKTARNYHEKAQSGNCLMLFGIGDGGGGPGEEHIERLEREKNLEGVPPVVQEPAARLLERVAEGSGYPSWAGELYLERHQGTYTTQARNKRYNRKIEYALREAELAAVRAMWTFDSEYPSGDLDAIWKEMLLYQFHDILPGSSITRVYDESLMRYAALLAQTEELAATARAVMLDNIDTAGLKRPVVVENSLSWERTEHVKTGEHWQQVTVPPLGYTTVEAASEAATWPGLIAAADVLENEILRVEFGHDGSIHSVYDKECGREALSAGCPANRLAVYEDFGDAWDFAMDYDERAPDHFTSQSVEAFIDGPRAVVRRVYRFGDSTLTQDVVLTAGSRRIDFVTRADWNEANKMLRTSFPVAVHATEATCEIQFGNLRRPTHQNTTWDLARFEVCAQKWVDLSDRGYGVALLNDCKYGHKLRGSVLDLNLLRSPGFPDPKADRAHHEFTYSLFPHSGDYAAGGVVQAGYELNVPLNVSEVAPHAGGLPTEGSFMQVSVPNVIVETVKKAEDGDDMIVRLYEAHGASGPARVSFGFPIASVSIVDLMEENPREIAVSEDVVELVFEPFEVLTLKIERPAS
jgi:alpha-mannosidase